MIDFSKLINFKYLLEPTPPFPFKFLLPLLGFFGLMFLLGIIIPWVLKRKYKKTPPFEKLASKIQTPFLIFSLLGFALFFFRWQAIVYLGSRVLILLLLLSILIWLISFLIYFKKGFKKELILWQEELRKAKYLKTPKK